MNKTKLRYFLPALTLLLSFSVLKAQKEECAVCLDKFYMFDHILTIKKTKYYKEAYSETFKPFERNYQRIKESDELCGVGFKISYSEKQRVFQYQNVSKVISEPPEFIMQDKGGNAIWETCKNCPISFQVEDKNGRSKPHEGWTYDKISGDMEVCVAIDESEKSPQVIYPRSGYEGVPSDKNTNGLSSKRSRRGKTEGETPLAKQSRSDRRGGEAKRESARSERTKKETKGESTRSGRTRRDSRQDSDSDLKSARTSASKVGWVDYQLIMRELGEVRDIQVELEKDQRRLTYEFNKMVLQLDSLKRTYEMQRLMNSPKGRSEKENEIFEMEKTINRFTLESSKFSKMQDERMQPVLRKINDAIERVAQDNRFDFVLRMDKRGDSSSGSGMLVYALDNYNLTEHVLNELGKRKQTK